MTIIQNLITAEGAMGEKFNRLMKKCMEIKELDEYLHNIDEQDKLLQNEHFNKDERLIYLKLEHQNSKILNIIQQKILNIQSKEKLSLSSAVFYANDIIENISNQDIANMEGERYVKISKLYLICTIIINNIGYVKIKQKAL